VIIAGISYLTAIVCGVTAYVMNEGNGDPVIASLMAGIVFFIGVGVVIQVIGSVDLPNLKIEH